ncbi:MAG: VOC family protein [Candidatus Aminicenantes bacterium]|nr:VOC family protein [Candidatus Aminicenantes bacterium]
MNKMTPVLYVDSIEASLPFWVDALGFARTVEVPDGDRLGFVILTSGNLEVMLQGYHSLEKDIPSLGKEMRGSPSVLYIEVKDIGEIERRLRGHQVVVPKRATPYGALEIFFRTPGGHVIGFAQQAAN